MHAIERSCHATYAFGVAIASTFARRIVAKSAITGATGCDQHDRQTARAGDPMFVVRYRSHGGEWCERRMADHRVRKIIKALGRREGVTQLHPHAFRHSSAVELLRRSRNLRAVQAHLRHSDIQTTTVYTEMTQSELQKVVNLFDEGK
jgi:site-specific recombinase XerC